jgi:uncharacterized protein YkwD
MRGFGVSGVVVVCLLAPAPAAAKPEILSAGLAKHGLTPGGLSVAVQATDMAQPVTSVSVRFPNAGGGFAMSACRVGRNGRAVAITRDADSRFEFPWVPVAAGMQSLNVTVTSGACGRTPVKARESFPITVGIPDVPAVPGAPGVPWRLPPLPTTGKDHEKKDRNPRSQAAQVPAAPVGTGCLGEFAVPTAENLTLVRSAIGCLVNVQRASRGLALLKSTAALRVAAGRHSRDMVRRHFFDHVGPRGPSLVRRLRRARYWPALAGENIGAGSGTLGTPVAMLLAWMDSDGHRENILNSRFRQVGVGVAVGTPDGSTADGATFTVDFGRR